MPAPVKPNRRCYRPAADRDRRWLKSAATPWSSKASRPIDDEPALAEGFDQQSALRKGRGKAANAAQIDRRSRADVELLAELLRSRGYYDAVVEPRIETSHDTLTVILAAEPGPQYTFSSVELPGLGAAGRTRPQLRKAFAVRTGRPGHRSGCD